MNFKERNMYISKIIYIMCVCTETYTSVNVHKVFMWKRTRPTQKRSQFGCVWCR